MSLFCKSFENLFEIHFQERDNPTMIFEKTLQQATTHCFNKKFYIDHRNNWQFNLKFSWQNFKNYPGVDTSTLTINLTINRNNMEKKKEIHGWGNRYQDKKNQKVNTVQRRIFVSFLPKYKITSVVNTIYIYIIIYMLYLLYYI